MQFFEKIKELRTEKGLSQTQLAIYLSLSQTAIAKLENKQREPTGSTLIAYANYFKCSIDFLVGRADDFGIIQTNDENLPTEEQELLNLFRKFNIDMKKSVLSTLKEMSKTFSINKNIKEA